MATRYFIGTSGWVYPHWRGRFYPEDLPERRWFAHYARFFDTVEINNTFYRLPDAGTVERWRAQSPAGFLYAVKASRYLTHIKRLKDIRPPLAQFLEIAGRLGDRLGPILVQLPESFACTAEHLGRLRAFCRALPPQPPFVLEFRHATWFSDEVYAVLREHGVNLCITSDPERPTDFQVTGAIVYVRFHGAGMPRYQGAYSDAELRAWARQIAALAAGRTACIYFNNDYNAQAVSDALRLRELLGVPGPAEAIVPKEPVTPARAARARELPAPADQARPRARSTQRRSRGSKRR